jgi:mycofactocin precursor
MGAPMKDSRTASTGISAPATTGGLDGDAVGHEEAHVDVVLDDLLVEDVSIDGMCGVY